MPPPVWELMDKIMRRFIRIVVLSIALLFVAPPEPVRAIDPVTLAILAPIALQLAEAARPYVIRGMINFGKGLLKVGVCMLQLAYIPYGLFKMLFLSSHGEFRSGLVYTFRGGIAFGKMLCHILLLPVYLCGVQVNMGTA